jgi:hypothetical protein
VYFLHLEYYITSSQKKQDVFCFFFDFFAFFIEGNLIFLKAHVYHAKTKTRKEPIVAIDMQKNLFTYFIAENEKSNTNSIEWGEQSIPDKCRWYA